jgi:lipid-binding SYLF domain-containing protein
LKEEMSGNSHTKDVTMKMTRTHSLIAAAVCLLAVMAHASDSKIEKKQTEIHTMVQDTLQRLYTAQPNAKSAVEGAAGYAVFSSTVAKIGLAGSGDGQGLAVDNGSKNQTFMKMLQLQGGLGFSVEKLRVVFVFDNEKAFNDFVNAGWQWGGQANAAAKTAEKGGAKAGAASVSDGVWMYQLTDKGLALDFSAGGTKYYKDKALN